MRFKQVFKEAFGKGLPNVEGSLHAESVQPFLVAHSGPMHDACVIAFEQGQRFLVVGTENGHVKLIGAHDLSVILPPGESLTRTRQLCLVPNTGRLVKLGGSRHIVVHELERIEIAAECDWPEEISCLAPIRRSHYLLIAQRNGVLTAGECTNESVKPTGYEVPTANVAGYGSGGHEAGNQEESKEEIISLDPQPQAEDERVLALFANGIVSVFSLREQAPAALASSSESSQGTFHCATWAGSFMFVVGGENGTVSLWRVPQCCHPGSKTFPNAPERCQLLQTLRIASSYGQLRPVKGIKTAVGALSSEGSLFAYGAEEEPGMPEVISEIPMEKPADDSSTYWLDSERRRHLPWFGTVCDIEGASKLGRAGSGAGAHASIVLSEGGQLHAHSSIFATSDSTDEPISEGIFQHSSFQRGPALMRVSTAKAVTVERIKNWFAESKYGDEESDAKSPSISPVTGGWRDMPEPDTPEELRRVMLGWQEDGTLTVWDASGVTNDIVTFKEVGSRCGNDLAFNGSSGIVAAISGWHARFYAFSGEERTVSQVVIKGNWAKESTESVEPGLQLFLDLIFMEETPTTVSLSKDGLRAAVGDTSGAITLLDLQEANVVWSSGKGACKNKISSLCVASNPEYDIHAATVDATLHCFDSSSGTPSCSHGLRPKTPSDMIYYDLLDSSYLPLDSSRAADEPSYALACATHAIRLYSMDSVLRGDRTSMSKYALESGQFQNAGVIMNSSCNSCFAGLMSTGHMLLLSLPKLEYLKKVSLSLFVSRGGPPISSTIGLDSQLFVAGEGDIARVSLLAPEELRIPSTFGDSVAMFDQELARAAEAADVAQLNAMLHRNETARETTKQSSYGVRYMPLLKSVHSCVGLAVDAFEFIMCQQKGILGAVSRKKGEEGNERTAKAKGVALEDVFATGREDEETSSPDKQETPEGGEHLHRKGSQQSSQEEKRAELGLDTSQQQKREQQWGKYSSQGKREGEEPRERSVEDIKAKYGRQAQSAAGKMEENKARIQERGERLSRVEQKTAEMESEAANFADLAKQLAEQQRGPFSRR